MRKIRNISTKDYIANMIRKEILLGEIKTGEELTQESIAQILGVSRMPVREALQALEQEGFLERMQNRHMKVVALNKEQIAETFRVIASLEAEILTLVVNKKESIMELSNVLAEMNKTNDNGKYVELEMEFHYTIGKLINNQYIRQFYIKLIDGYVSYSIESYSEKAQTLELLTDIVICAINNEISNINKYFQLYYKVYTEKLEIV